ncbi:heterocyst frequency control protein PatD [Pseudanabaena sp. FACHB-1998]|uniref:heterocyst frequency control protein PatD n=1 Tax=Pseudanabaena sp. FACHB-1998 TaxID=2692858 RepID=UPI00167FE8FF|nr:heterocyst frequency control protein PatD [Pseudanabaena sp. FACHB-1998]MBD2178724.1 heterocyst frequency control protein PatD [Pseudanabaena sp. FACHB-1998]
MSESYLNLILDLQDRLESLQTAIASQPEPAPAIAQDWQRSLKEIQAFFQQQIVNTSLEVTPPHLSLQVEIDKQLKMLGVDLSMLQTSRSLATWQKRHQQISDRFVTLQKYCQMHTS